LGRTFGLLLPVLGGLAGLVLLFVIARSGLDAWRLQRLPPQTALAVLYRRLRLAGSKIGAEMHPADTPYETAARISAQVEKFGGDGRASPPLYQIREGLRWLVERYALGAYSPRPLTPVDRSQGIRTWRELRRRLWLAQLRRNVRKFF
jgi:hypothetical protein